MGNIAHGERGSATIKILVIVAVAGALFTVMGNIGPKVYDFFTLRELADRVTQEYAKLSPAEVRRRVDFELHRSKIEIDKKHFAIKRTTKGYKVNVDYRIPLVFTFGGKEISLGEYVEGMDEWQLTYLSES